MVLDELIEELENLRREIGGNEKVVVDTGTRFVTLTEESVMIYDSTYRKVFADRPALDDAGEPMLGRTVVLHLT